jgi:hypothetical protein
LRETWPQEKGDPDGKLHVPKIGAINLPLLLQMMGEARWPGCDFARTWLTDPSVHATDNVVDMLKWRMAPRMNANLWKQLLSSGYLQQWDGPTVPPGVGLLSVVWEGGKQRWRLILESLTDNLLAPEAPKAHIRPVNDMVTMFAKKRFFAKTDWKCFYYGFRFTVDIAGHWAVFKPGAGWFVFLGGPMGHKNMVFVGHTTTQFLVWITEQRHPTVVYDVIIDDVGMGGDDAEELQRAQATLLELAHRVGIETSKVAPPATSLEHRGLVFDWRDEQCHVQLKPQFVERATARVGYVIAQREITQRQLESLAGMMAWTIAALSTLEDGPDFTAFATYRSLARLSAMGPSAKQKMTFALHTELEQWVAACRRSGTVTRVRPSQRPWLVVTDACSTSAFAGWGGVVVSPGGEVTVVKGTFADHERHHITVLEMMAVEKTLASTGRIEAMRHHATVVACDNSPVVATLARRRSRSYPLHCALKRVLAWLRQVPYRAIWIPTATNPTDGISRGKDWCVADEEKLHMLLNRAAVIAEPQERLVGWVVG